MAVESHHIFLSYARKDNLPRADSPGPITGFVERLKKEYFGIAGSELRVFFDIEDIRGMDQWQHRTLHDLNASYILLPCLSPAYLASECCQWEFNEYRKGETRRSLAEAGVAPVYAFDIPGWFEGSYSKTAPEWVQRLRDRQSFDLRSYFGDQTQQHVLLAPQLGDLAEQLAERIRRFEGNERSPGFVNCHNYFFIGRASEMELLRHRLVSPGSSADFVALHGLGGIGKTSLAVEYAHNFAHEYQAGRW